MSRANAVGQVLNTLVDDHGGEGTNRDLDFICDDPRCRMWLWKLSVPSRARFLALLARTPSQSLARSDF